MIKVRGAKYVVYGVSDPAKTSRFMEDFGLAPVAWQGESAYLRGALPAPYVYVAEKSDAPSLKAFGLEVESAEDLARATQIDGASTIHDLDRPGGGQVVEVFLPGGIKLELVHGIADAAPLPIEAPLVINEGLRKARFNAAQRPARVPAQVLRLGHVVLGVPDPVAAKDWAVRNLGMIVSDAMLVPGSKDDFVGFFMRCDRGRTPCDHHTLLITQAASPSVHHIAFEVQDIDTVFMGHEWMKGAEHRPHWGVGRHVLGSQVFGYWWDPDGFRVEHYADGDVYDSSVPATTVEGTHDQLWAWGPEVPHTFFQQTRET
ncbi:VOC family protein [Variovorax sp. WS11]|uniref:VOC family protein n=1 Tax=Variovorax sp. WS11 TaxID=1105204 RepID=UPI0013DC7A84|nr:VOC family protein [Variovorax sp. WS11]NDZ17500.1 bleomycin resistance protein [Variovorax sp. WS11]